MSKQRMLLTGSAGFIGSNFIRKVIYDKYPYELYSVDKIANSSILNNIYQHKLHEFYMADICDHHIMDKIFEYVQPEIVVHMAAESAVDKSIHDPNVFIKSNVLGTQTMINLALKYKVNIFCYQSTDEVYGSLNTIEDNGWDENASIAPKNPYAASKAAGELLIRAAGNTHKLPFIIVRSCNNYGPRQTPDKLIPRTIKCLLENNKIPLYGKGNQIRDWIHVHDNVSAILRILKDGIIGETYNISANHEISNLQLIQSICDNMGHDYSLISLVEDRPGHDFRYSVNSSKLKKMGWYPNYKFANGLKQCIEWYQLNSYYLK